MKDLKDKAREIAVEAGIIKPTATEKIKKGAKDLLKGGREELGLAQGFTEQVGEFFTGKLEDLGVKEPRVGKSFVDVIKGAFGMLASITGTKKEQDKVLEKFDKACENFSRAMSALFKTHGKEKDGEAVATRSSYETRRTKDVKKTAKPTKTPDKGKDAHSGRTKGGFVR